MGYRVDKGGGGGGRHPAVPRHDPESEGGEGGGRGGEQGCGFAVGKRRGACYCHPVHTEW